MFRMALSEREYVNWLKTNRWLTELAELPNTPDRRSIKRVFERTPLEYWERLEAEIQKIIPDSKVYVVSIPQGSSKARGPGHGQIKITGERTSKNCT